MSAATQIPLPFDPLRPDRLEDFLPGPNAAVLHALTTFGDGSTSAVYLWGAAGSGKSHLLQGLCRAVREEGSGAVYIPAARLPVAAAAGLAGLTGVDLLCFDDFDAVAGVAAWERALFDAFNQLHEAGGRIVISASGPLDSLQIGLPDLRSRLGWGLRLELRSLREPDKSAVLRQRAEGWGLQLPDEVVSWLMRRCHRNLGDMIAALEELREAALSQQRRITVPLARQVLRIGRKGAGEQANAE